MDIIKGVAVSLIDQSNNILLVQENETKLWKKKGDIGILMGGIDDKEFAKHAALREISEETGLQLSDCLHLNDTSFYIPEHNLRIDVELYGALVDDLLPFMGFSSHEIADVFAMDYNDYVAMVVEHDGNIRPGNREILLYLLSHETALKDRLITFGTQRLQSVR